ncbi:MAG: hypothetical protein ACOCVP_06875, partial [Wenzhouxiangella sp.]
MTGSSPWLAESPSPGQKLHLVGDWRIHHAAELQRTLKRYRQDCAGLDGTGIEALDAAGAFLLLGFARRLGVDVEAIELEARQRELLLAVADSLEVDQPG